MNDFTPESFKRRAYWLKDNSKYIIVHYLDEANKYYLNYLQIVNSKNINEDFKEEFELNSIGNL